MTRDFLMPEAMPLRCAFSNDSAWQFHRNSNNFRWRVTLLQCNSGDGVKLQSI